MFSKSASAASISVLFLFGSVIYGSKREINEYYGLNQLDTSLNKVNSESQLELAEKSFVE
jgi:hypothetical protein